jgi:signal transduction histidine kinase/CheY-like chemotaxis protein/HAMP domain-containing protein
LTLSEPVYAGDRAYYRQALATQDFAAGEYQIGRITGRPGINFGYPVFAENGQVSAVVFAALDLAWLNDLAANLHLAEGTVLLMVDRQGAILTRYPDDGQWGGQRVSGTFMTQATLSEQEATATELVGLDGVPRLYIFAQLSNESQVGALLGVGIPIAAIYEAAVAELARNLTGLAIMALLFLALALVSADFLVLRRVKALVEAARRLGGGDLSARTGQAHDAGEMGVLAQTFDEMAESLERREAQHQRAEAEARRQAATNAQLYDQAQRRLRRLQALNAIDRAITARYQLEETLDVVLEQVTTQLEVDAANILLLDREESVLTFAAGRGFRSKRIQNIRLPLGEGYGGRVALEHQTLIIPDLENAEGFLQAPQIAGEGFVNYCGVPLITEGEVQGILGVFNRSALEFEAEWIGFLEALALQAAIAIDNARLFGETLQLLEQTQTQAREIEQIVDTMPEGILLLTARQQVKKVNPLGQEYLAALSTATVGDIVDTIGDQPLERLLQPVSTGQLWQKLPAQKSNRSFEFAALPIEYEAGVAGWVILLRDVTEERRHQEYQQAQDRLATLGQLTAGIAHDFNNIMAIISIHSQTLTLKPDHPKRREYLVNISTQAMRAAELIGQLLDFSRASPLKRTPIDLLPLVKELVKLMKRTLPSNVVISLDSGEGDYIVEADPTRLQQVLMNLAVNAQQAMAGGGKLHIALRLLNMMSDQQPPLPDMEAGEYICLSVADTGNGIPEAALPRIFEPFFTTKPRGQGTGLGLAQVHGIVKQHDGFITVTSTPVEGTTFTIYLPAADVSKGAFVQRPDETNMAALGGDETILLVEDNPFARTAVHDALQEMGYRVLEAENGQQALMLLQQEPDAIDLVISDSVMPEMGGLALHERLARDFTKVHFIMMSGYSPEIRDDIVWVKKPFTISELTGKIRQVLAGDSSES